jgi:hypothetical protein
MRDPSLNFLAGQESVTGRWVLFVLRGFYPLEVGGDIVARVLFPLGLKFGRAREQIVPALPQLRHGHCAAGQDR